MFDVKEYGGNYYGSYGYPMDYTQTSKNVIFKITPDRALEMKQKNPNTCLILLLPPTVQTLDMRRENRSSQRVDDDIKNLDIAKNFDYVVVNDDLKQTYIDVLECLEGFENNVQSNHSIKQNIDLIEKFILEFKRVNLSSSVEQTFNGVANEWDGKSRFVTYYGENNPIKNLTLLHAKNGLKIADIGCGTGKLIAHIDNNFVGCRLTGLDISSGMIDGAQNRLYTNNNNIIFVNADFMDFDLEEKFDMIIFSYVLHHLQDPIVALNKARKMLSDDGRILFAVPGKEYLKEVFDDDSMIGRFSLDDMDMIASEAGLYPESSCRNRFMLSCNSYVDFQNYLKSIGTYQKIVGYTNDEWASKFDKQTQNRFEAQNLISGEYLTYNCLDKQKLLVRR